MAVAEAVESVEQHEAANGLRQRRRKKLDRRVFRRTVEAVVCDVLHLHCTRRERQPMGETPVGRWLHASMSDKHLSRGVARYRATAETSKLRDVVRALAALGWIEWEPGSKRNPFREDGVERYQTRLRAGRVLLEREGIEGVTAGDFGADEPECIVLRGRQREGQPYRPIGYTDTPATHKYRDQLRRINAAIGTADITYEPSDPTTEPADASQRFLRRYFLGNFESHGRLYGGFWQRLDDGERLDGIKIDGEPVAVLDYGQCSAHIVYGTARVVPHWRDAYAIPGLEGRRPLVKRAFNAMLNADRRLTQPPGRKPRKRNGDDGLPDDDDVRSLVAASGMRWAAVRDAIEQFHAPVAGWFYRGGAGLTLKESTILVEVLLACTEQGLIALPVHDCLIVPVRRREEAKAIMRETFRRHTSLIPSIKETLPGGETARE